MLPLVECPSCFEVVAVYYTGKMRRSLPGLVCMHELDSLVILVFSLMGKILVFNFFLASLMGNWLFAFGLGECPLDPGGYFVIKGTEKVKYLACMDCCIYESKTNSNAYAFAKVPNIFGRHYHLPFRTTSLSLALKSQRVV